MEGSEKAQTEKRSHPAKDEKKMSKKNRNKEKKDYSKIGDGHATPKISKSSSKGDKKRSPPDANQHESPKKNKKAKQADNNTDQNRKKIDNQPLQEVGAWSKSKKKRMRHKNAKLKKASEGSSTSAANLNADNLQTTDKKEFKNIMSTKQGDDLPKNGGPSSLQKSFAARLAGSRFRILNEELYTTTSATSFNRFQSNPELFDQYHEGFRHQVEQWPSNPVDVIFKWLTKKYSSSGETVVVADFGCGDAELAKRLLEFKSLPADKKVNKKKQNQSQDSCPFKVHSFDLIAQSDLVTECDMANVPLGDKSVDVGVFCLALMGTNITDFLAEAHRVLKDDGRVKIAEVRSRFETASGKDDLDEFVKQLNLLGFDCAKVDRSNKMFVLMELKKNRKKPDRKIDVKIKPCIYKRR